MTAPTFTPPPGSVVISQKWLAAIAVALTALVAALLGSGAVTIGGTTTSTVATTTTVPATTTSTTTTLPASTIGAPSDVGLTIPVSTLVKWTGSSTITTSLTGYLFTTPITVTGNVTISNSKIATNAQRDVTIAGTATPGPVFSHVEIDGQNWTGSNDDIGITNSSRDNGGVQGVTKSPFTCDRCWIHNVVNGTRLDSGATLRNTLINGLQVFGGSHTDASEEYCGSGITIDHSTFDAIAPAGMALQATNAAAEQQGGSGGFCPVSNVTWSNDILSGGGVTWRIDDAQVTNVTVTNVQVIAGTFEWKAFSVTNSASIKSWSGVTVRNPATGVVTTVPPPFGAPWGYGCGVNTDCN